MIIYLKHLEEDIGKRVGIVCAYLGVFAWLHFLKQSGQIFGHKRRTESAHFIEHTPERPDIAFEVVRLVSPDLGRGVERSAGLSIGQIRRHFAHVQIRQFEYVFAVQKYVRTF